MKKDIIYQNDTIFILGYWTVLDAQKFSDKLSTLILKKPSKVIIKEDSILDIAITKILYKLCNSDFTSHEIEIVSCASNQDKINSLVKDVSLSYEVGDKPKSLSFLESVGKSTIEVWNESLSILSFVSSIVKEVFLIFLYPKRFRIREIVAQIDHTGLNAVPISALVTFLIGIVITYLMGNQLKYYGANIFVVDGVSVAMCRELSPILIAIIVAGRSGSAFAAQLGSMRLNQEVEALRVMGLSSISVLIIPRIIALMMTMPVLVVVGDIFGIIGGLFISYIHLEVSPENFIERLKMVLATKHIFIGIAKAPIFALFIASIGCRLGLNALPNAVSIGQNTTKTVVQSIVSVILLNALIAIILSNLGI